jgi:predicted metalloprotease/predicted DNA-binding ribbon-helix-helix protein
MKWRGRRTSGNIEDRRGGGMGRAGASAASGLVVALLVGAFFGVDITPFLGGGGGGVVQTGAPPGPNSIDDTSEEFVGVVLADTEEVWSDIFAASGLTYQEPVLVLFAGQTTSACGGADAAMGPFYCPTDRRVFLDTDFFRTLEQRMGATGDFAAAYVIAHEVAHHVQNELGVLGQVNAERRRLSQAESNELSVRIELQADCYAGLWARHAEERFGVLEQGDIEEALNTAAAIGDDALAARLARGGGARQLHARHERAAAAVVLPGLRDRAIRRPATPSGRPGCERGGEPPDGAQAAQTRGGAGRGGRAGRRGGRGKGRAGAEGRGGRAGRASAGAAPAGRARRGVSGRPVKRSLTLRGHRTSVSLEGPFWDAFVEIARAEGKAVAALAAEIDEARGTEMGLATAIRLHVLAWHRGRSGR